ncbi:MAG: hypothetical protein HQL51_14140, partial [Magnetococcales bacterium]|nr:hypothetical protein [Magnetococcales bacterium]
MNDIGLILLGAGGHALVVLEACRLAGRRVAGLLDPALPPGSLVLGAPVLGGDERLDDPEFVAAHEWVVGSARREVMARLAARLEARGANTPTVIHPRAVISPSVVLERGGFVAAGVVVQALARVGPFTLLNTACSVDHEAVIGRGCHVAPGARILGRAAVGE